MKIWKNTNTLDEYITDDIILIEDKKEVDIIVVGGKSFDLNDFPNLKGIFKVGVGTDNISFDECKKRNIKVQMPSEKTKQIIYNETADFTCYCILNMLYKNKGNVSSWTKYNRRSLSTHKLLIIGQGNIGKLVKDKMKNFMSVNTFDILKNSMVELDDMIRECDIMSLHIPLNKDTKNFIDKDKLSLLNGLLINTSRGGIVNENDLYDAIKKGNINTHFDVFWKEPYDGILKGLDGFHMSPHIASTCNEFLESLYDDLKEFMSNIL